LFQDGKDRLEATAFATGSGSGQPKGVVTVLQAVTASRVAATTNGSFGAIDVYKLAEALPARYQPNASWLANFQWAYEIRQFGTATSNVAANFWCDFGAAVPSTLLGLQWNGCSGMQVTPLSTATASSDDILIAADFTQFYTVVDRMGSTVGVNPWVQGSNRRPTKETHFLLTWRTGGDSHNSDAARLLRV